LASSFIAKFKKNKYNKKNRMEVNNMRFENIYKNPQELINDLENYAPYIIKIKCYKRNESEWLQNKPYYSIMFEKKYFYINKTKYPIKYIEKITFKTKDKIYGKCEYVFQVSQKYFDELKKTQTVLSEQPIDLEKNIKN
jgi:hypothetical protein